MTKEEAIKILQGIDRLIGDDFYSDTTEEAVEMAIEALQAPPISQRKMYQAGYRQGKEDALKTAIAYANMHLDLCSKSRLDVRGEDE